MQSTTTRSATLVALMTIGTMGPAPPAPVGTLQFDALKTLADSPDQETAVALF
jgi:hypothetical protein